MDKTSGVSGCLKEVEDSLSQMFDTLVPKRAFWRSIHYLLTLIIVCTLNFVILCTFFFFLVGVFDPEHPSDLELQFEISIIIMALSNYFPWKKKKGLLIFPDL